MNPQNELQLNSTKAELRTRYLAERRQLTSAEVKRRSQLIAWRFFDYFESNKFADTPALVHTFLPIRRQNEVDTWPIITGIWSKYTDINISVPVTDLVANEMAHYTISPDTPLIENRLGIPEPAAANRYESDLTHVKVVLVPLLAFDRQGQRVGYGGGFYDRFLARNVPESHKIGLSLFDPVNRNIDVEPTDVRLDACITPGQVWSFGPYS